MNILSDEKRRRHLFNFLTEGIFMIKINGKKTEKIISIILMIIIAFWFIPYINKGLDVQDTCSYLTKFKYIFERDIWVNELYYFFGELIGGIIYHIMPSHQLIALNVASWLCYTTTAFLIYYMLKDYMPQIPLLLAALCGSFFGITWVHCLNWNAISMLLQTLSIIIMLKALKEDSNKKLLLSGFMFGINTYVRMPNILQLAMVAVVFWNYLIVQINEEGSRQEGEGLWECIKKIKWKLPFVKSLIFALGGLIAGITGALIVIMVLGYDKFITDILNLLGVSGKSESSHGIVRIISLFYRGMLQGGLNWLKLIILSGTAVLIFFIGNRISKRSQNDIKAYEIIICMAIMAVFGIISGYRADFIDAHVLVAFGALAFGIIFAIYYAKTDIEFSNLCACAAVATAVLTIGTDTGSAYYRVYMGLPLAIICAILIKIAKTAPNYIKMLCNLMLAFALAFTLSAGIHYATTFVYHDSDNEYLTTKVNNPIFGTIKTSKERAELIDDLEKLLKPYSEYKLMTLGSFNIGYVITDMEPFFNSSWPDLEYLSLDEFKEYIQAAKDLGEYPVVVMGDMERNMSGYWNMDKYNITMELVKSDAYKEIYSSPLCQVYVPANSQK